MLLIRSIWPQKTWIFSIASSSNIQPPTQPTAEPKDKVVEPLPIAAYFVIIGDTGVSPMTPRLIIDVVEIGQYDLIKHG